jgi:hypothetical protein
MHATEVKKGHVQMNRGCQMFERLAETETQSRKAAKVRSHAKIGAFDMARADSFELGVSADAYWDGRRYLGRVVPLRAFAVRRSVDFEQLGEINIGTKRFFDGGNVVSESVGRNLESADNALAQIADKIVGAGASTLGDEIGENHFRFGINRHPDVLVSPFLRSVTVEMGFFGVNESPKFIGLHESRTDFSHSGIEKVSTLLSHREKQRKNRALVRARNARNRTHRHSFEQERCDLCGSLCRNVVASERFLAGFRESTFAGGATESLNLAASVGSKSVCFGVLAADAGHAGFSLVFLREKPDNHGLGSECGLLPRLDSVLPSALTDGRALSFSFLLCPHEANLVSRHLLLLYFSVLGESGDYRVQRSHEVSIFFCVESQLLKARSQCGRFQRGAIRLERLPYGVGQSEFISLIKRLIQSVGQTANDYPNGCDSLFQVLLSRQAFAEFSLKNHKLCLCRFQRLVEIKSLCHNGGIVQCVQIEVKENQ